MDKGIKEYWLHQASVQEKDEIDALRKVLDPADVKGVKNSYIDAYLKYYLCENLLPEKTDTLLEVGCGIGRLTEYLAQFVHAVYGTDIADKFIEDCRSTDKKSDNTFYHTATELDEFKGLPVNKMYIVWVLMYRQNESELIELLRSYIIGVPQLKTAVILEQVKSSMQTDYRDGRVNCYFRTIEEYTEIFRSSGFDVKGYTVMGERYYGHLYRAIHVLGNFLPKQLAGKSEMFFHFDRKMMSDSAGRVRLINKKIPVDVAFRLEVA